MNLDKLQQLTGSENTYFLQVFLVIFAALSADLIQRKILRRLYEKLRDSSSFWDDAVIDALRRPLTLIIWTLGISFAARIVQDATGAVIFNFIDPLQDTLIIAALTWFVIRLIRRGEKNFIDKKKAIDKTTVDAISKLLRISAIITALLVTLQTLGYSISGVLAFGGVGGIAIGFAAKDLLANFFGGLTIYLDRPFAVGDWIRSPDRDIEGTVEEIGWRLTRIRTFDQRPLYVPNSTFTTIALENPSRMKNRRIYETIGIRYQDAPKMNAIIKKVREMLENHPEIDTGRTLIVNFNKFASSSLDFFIYTFTRTTGWVKFHEIKQDVLLKILDIIEAEGAECAFPTSTLHLADAEFLKHAEPEK
ncbi:MAG: mechanosensitive ion channel family protein [Nitrospinaceae bacterium]|nr:MAG: mechanosensitive ion channel family protein [Nitrospinaceae bacterium]